MSKVYVFGIGGTGSRVLRSLTMLLATGVKFGAEEVVPIIIDPDNGNADLTRTVGLLNNYVEIREDLQFPDENANRFFRTEILRLLPNYTLRIEDTEDRSFRRFIEYSSMSKANKAITKMLFSDKNLESSMDVGFKGNPNIGSVVLNQIARSEAFAHFANSFEQGDRIFIISSIFGGTGASGFPLLLKTLREGRHFPNFNLINNAPIGAITILPYFKLKQNDESEIDSSTFISKAKSALAYYEQNISGSGIVDSLYYLGDNVTNLYNNHEGGSQQRNEAHLIEFLAATAVVRFSNDRNGHTGFTTNYELGIKDIDGAVTFESFYNQLYDMLYMPMVQFTMMTNALTDNLNYFKSGNFNANKKGDFTDLYSSNFFKALSSFFDKYVEWLMELENNKRSLDLFNLRCNKKPFELVTGVKPKKVMSHHSDYDLVSDRLNGEIKHCKSKGKENRFLEMYYLGTRKLVSEKLMN